MLSHQNAWGRCIIVSKHHWGTLGCIGDGFRAGGNTVFAVKIHQTFPKGQVFPRMMQTLSNGRRVLRRVWLSTWLMPRALRRRCELGTRRRSACGAAPQ